MKKIGIYLLTCTVNKKCYVGQSRDVDYRIKSHFKGTGKTPIKKVISKYGRICFRTEILEICSEETLDDRECHWIDALDCIVPNGYNLMAGGSHGTHNKITRAKLSKAHKGRRAWNKGKKAPLEVRKKMSQAQKGKTGKKNNFYGRKHSLKTRKRWSEIRKGRTHSAETRQKLSEATKKYWAKRRQNRLQIPLFEETD